MIARHPFVAVRASKLACRSEWAGIHLTRDGPRTHEIEQSLFRRADLRCLACSLLGASHCVTDESVRPGHVLNVAWSPKAVHLFPHARVIGAWSDYEFVVRASGL